MTDSSGTEHVYRVKRTDVDDRVHVAVLDDVTARREVEQIKAD